MSSPQNPKGPTDPNTTSATIQSLLESKNPNEALVASSANQNIQRSFDDVIDPEEYNNTTESQAPESAANSVSEDEDQKETLVFDIKQLSSPDESTGLTTTNTSTRTASNSNIQNSATSSDIVLDFSAHDQSLVNLIEDESANGAAQTTANASPLAEAPKPELEPAPEEPKIVELAAAAPALAELNTESAGELAIEEAPTSPPESEEAQPALAEIELGEYREDTVIELGAKRAAPPAPAAESALNAISDLKIEESIKNIGQNAQFSPQELESSLGISLNPITKKGDDTQEIDASLLDVVEAPAAPPEAPPLMQEFQYRDHETDSHNLHATDHEPDDEFLAEAARFAKKTADETQNSLNLQTASVQAKGTKSQTWSSVQSASLSKRAFEDLRKSSEELLHYQEDELVRVQATLRTLREEMTQLNQKCDQLELEKQQLRQHNLDLKSERDELKIEVTLLHKRINDEIENYQYQLRVVEGKRDLYAERARQLKQELDGVQKNIKINVKTIRQREQELEGQLELLRIDSETQVQHRDQKILELKRTIDTLEFERDSVVEQQQKFTAQQLAYETKLHKLERQLQQVIALISDPSSDPKDPYQAPKKVLERKLRFD